MKTTMTRRAAGVQPVHRALSGRSRFMNEISSKRSFPRSAGREMTLGEFSLQRREGGPWRDNRVGYACSSGHCEPDVPVHTFLRHS